MTNMEPAGTRLEPDAALRAASARADRLLTGAPGVIRSYTAHLAGAHGKLLRARALIACSLGGDGLAPPEAPAAAAAVELLHLATLVHDDVIDDAPTRRGIPTLHTRSGRRAAVICGDYLLSAALRLAAEAVPRDRDARLPDYAGRICRGELRQQENSGNLGLSVLGYLKIIDGKTAALFEAAYRAGALLGDAGEREARRYGRLGRWIGMIFQLADDCIDFEQEESAARKPVRSDYENGVITLPLIRTLERSPALAERARLGVLSRLELDEAVRMAGGLAWTRALAARYYRRAARLIGTLTDDAAKHAALEETLAAAFAGFGSPPAVHAPDALFTPARAAQSI